MALSDIVTDFSGPKCVTINGTHYITIPDVTVNLDTTIILVLTEILLHKSLDIAIILELLGLDITRGSLKRLG